MEITLKNNYTHCFPCSAMKSKIGSLDLDFTNSVKMGNGISGFHSITSQGRPAGKIQVDVLPA